MSHARPANTYPDSIFQQTTADESQELSSGPRFTTLIKDTRTRAELYTRVLPDDTSAALCIDGPATGSSSGHIALDSLGRVKILTGDRTDNSPASGQLQIKTFGQVQQHLEASYIEYNAGQDEGEYALNIKAYGKVTENCVGHQRTIKATKIVIDADDLLVIKGQNVRIQAQGELQLAGSQMTKVLVNDKEIILGQKMVFGAGEDTRMAFDPRANISVISTGHVNHQIIGDYRLRTGGVMHMEGAGGTFAAPLIKTGRQFGLKMNTLTKSYYGGNVSAELNAPIVKVGGGQTPGIVKVNATDYSLDTSGKADMTIQGTSKYEVTGNLDIEGSNLNVKGANTVVEGTGMVEVKSAGNVKITGALIYLN
tara:strand:+ start:2406 stop:3506 length:1101 start_codon:yes stop_codon:yes gene_type:complete